MKKIQIIIISLISILVLGCIAFAALYFATDVFKSDKELFYKNISQMDLSKLMDTAQSTKYQERLKTEKFKNEGSVSIGVNAGEEMNISESFTYTSQVDNANKLADSSVTISKEGNDLLTINYLRNEDLYGLQFKDIVSQYIVLENNNLKEFAQKLGIQDVTNVPDKIDLSESEYDYSTTLNEEELKQVANKYINIIIEQIPKENYSKVEDGYKLVIDLKTIQNVLIKVINEIKDDEQVFNLINSFISAADSSKKLDFGEYQEIFQEAIEELSQEIEQNYNILEIVAYKQGKIYIRIATDVVDGGTAYIAASIAKNEEEMVFSLTSGDENDENLNLNINKNIETTEKDICGIELIAKEYGEEVGNVVIETIRNGNLESNNIQNSISLSILAPTDNLEISMECSNNKTFDSAIEIEEFTASNHAKINDLDTTQINNLITNLNNMITQKTGLNAIEFIGGAGVGIISTLDMDFQKMALAGGAVVGAGISIYTTKANYLLMDKAQNAVQETQNAIKQEEELYQNVEQQLEKTEKHSIYEQINGLVSLTNAGKIDVEATYMEAKSKLENQGMAVSQIGEDGKFIVTGEYGEYTYIVTENSINIVTE